MTYYKAYIEFDNEPETVPCVCSNCNWAGTADSLKEIDEAILTPGDPSPAGRCPRCESLAYIKEAS